MECLVLLLELKRWEASGDVMEHLAFLLPLSLPGRLSWEGFTFGCESWILIYLDLGFFPSWIPLCPQMRLSTSRFTSLFPPPSSILLLGTSIPHSSSLALWEQGRLLSILGHLTHPIIPAHAPQPDCSTLPSCTFTEKTMLSAFCFFCGSCR